MSIILTMIINLYHTKYLTFCYTFLFKDEHHVLGTHPAFAATQAH